MSEANSTDDTVAAAVKASLCASPQWIEDCLHHYGRVLLGRLGHWCNGWDGLPIDETTGEFHLGEVEPGMLVCKACGFSEEDIKDEEDNDDD